MASFDISRLFIYKTYLKTVKTLKCFYPTDLQRAFVRDKLHNITLLYITYYYSVQTTLKYFQTF
jgi:hypothetical protein